MADAWVQDGSARQVGIGAADAADCLRDLRLPMLVCDQDRVRGAFLWLLRVVKLLYLHCMSDNKRNVLGVGSKYSQKNRPSGVLPHCRWKYLF